MFIVAYSIFILAYQYHRTDTPRHEFVRRLASVAWRALERHATSGLHVTQEYVGKHLRQLRGMSVPSGDQS